MVQEIPVVYVVSDSVGETAEAVVRAAASQFNGGHVLLRRVSHVNSVAIIDATIVKAQAEHAVVAFTLVVPELKIHLIQSALKAQVQCVDIMGPIMEALESLVGLPPQHKAGLVHQLDDDYFQRIEAIEFAVKYDDGKDPRGLERADVILVGVSRTSKTPLSMYLAHKQIKVANVPLVPEVAPPEDLFRLDDPEKVIGLSIRAEKLNRIREERLKALGLGSGANYANPTRIKHELQYAAHIMNRLQCKVIDVTDKAVEETAGIVLDYIAGRGGSR